MQKFCSLLVQSHVDLRFCQSRLCFIFNSLFFSSLAAFSWLSALVVTQAKFANPGGLTCLWTVGWWDVGGGGCSCQRLAGAGCFRAPVSSHPHEWDTQHRLDFPEGAWPGKCRSLGSGSGFWQSPLPGAGPVMAAWCGRDAGCKPKQAAGTRKASVFF